MALVDDVFTRIFGSSDSVIVIDGPGYYAINPGSYTSLTVNADVDAGVEIVASGVSFSGGLSLLGDRTTLLTGVGFSTGALSTVSGVSCSILGSGSGAMAGIYVDGDDFCVHGGGRGFVVDGGLVNAGAQVVADRGQIRSLTARTDRAGDKSAIIVNNGRLHTVIDGVKVSDSGDEGMLVAGSRSRITRCVFVTALRQMLKTGTASVGNVISDCVFADDGNTGVQIRGDDEVFIRNVNRSTNSSTGNQLDGDGCLYSGNRLAVAAVDNGANNVVANNLVGAFAA